MSGLDFEFTNIDFDNLDDPDVTYQLTHPNARLLQEDPSIIENGSLHNVPPASMDREYRASNGLPASNADLSKTSVIHDLDQLKRIMGTIQDATRQYTEMFGDGKHSIEEERANMYAVVRKFGKQLTCLVNINTAMLKHCEKKLFNNHNLEEELVLVKQQLHEVKQRNTYLEKQNQDMQQQVIGKMHECLNHMKGITTMSRSVEKLPTLPKVQTSKAAQKRPASPSPEPDPKRQRKSAKQVRQELMQLQQVNQ